MAIIGFGGGCPYQIGSHITTDDQSFNPNITYVGTKWKSIQGCVLGGVNKGDADTNKKTSFNQGAGTLIGNKYIHSHLHGGNIQLASKEVQGYGLTITGGFKNRVIVTGTGVNTGIAGSGDAQNIQPTYLTYIWLRTS